MEIFSAYDLISLLSEDMQSGYSISGEDLNELHKVLLENNVRSDFSRFAFEELAAVYPKNISFESQQIIVKIESTHTTFYNPFVSFKKDDHLKELVVEQWKTIKEY